MNKDTRIKDYPVGEAVKELAIRIAKCYQLLGISFKAEYPLEEMSKDLVTMLRNRHPNATMAQIERAMLNGINGDYGAVKGLSVTDMVSFVKEYVTPKNIVNYQAAEESQPKMLERDRKADLLNLMQSLYESFLADRPIYAFPPCGSFILLLWDHDMMLNTRKSEVQEQYIEKARAAIREEKESQIGANPLMMRTVERELRNLSETTVKEKSYKLIVLDFFKDCKDMDIRDIHELFNTK